MRRRANRKGKKSPFFYARTATCCEELISEGADVNAVDHYGQTPLHYAILHRIGLDAVKVLLKHGARVSACDSDNCTPLMVAVRSYDRSELDVVKVLLEYRSYPNVCDHEGISLLSRALRKNDLDLLRELLKWGASINIANTAATNTFATPMNEAVACYIDAAKLFIKMEVFKFCCNKYKKLINLERFRGCSNFSELSVFKEDCVCEVLRMKSYRIGRSYSLYELIVNRRKSYKPVYFNDCTMRDIFNNFPIYHIIIRSNMNPHFERGELFDKVRNTPLHVRVIKNVDDGSRHQVSLNPDCCCMIAEYLSNNDLSALIEAYNV